MTLRHFCRVFSILNTKIKLYTKTAPDSTINKVSSIICWDSEQIYGKENINTSSSRFFFLSGIFSLMEVNTEHHFMHHSDGALRMLKIWMPTAICRCWVFLGVNILIYFEIQYFFWKRMGTTKQKCEEKNAKMYELRGDNT